MVKEVKNPKVNMNEILTFVRNIRIMLVHKLIQHQHHQHSQESMHPRQLAGDPPFSYSWKAHPLLLML